MKPLGWAFLIVSWSVLTYFTVWCFVKIFTTPFEPDNDEGPPHSA
jgi:hypothetical protein